jgi:hypothetical protein
MGANLAWPKHRCDWRQPVGVELGHLSLVKYSRCGVDTTSGKMTFKGASITGRTWGMADSTLTLLRNWRPTTAPNTHCRKELDRSPVHHVHEMRWQSTSSCKPPRRQGGRGGEPAPPATTTTRSPPEVNALMHPLYFLLRVKQNGWIWIGFNSVRDVRMFSPRSIYPGLCSTVLRGTVVIGTFETNCRGDWTKFVSSSYVLVA